MNKELIAVRNRMKALNDAYRKEKDPEKSTEIKDKMEGNQFDLLRRNGKNY